MKDSITKVRNELITKCVELEAVEAELRITRASIMELKEQKEAWKEAQTLIQSIVSVVQNRVYKRLCTVATKCLQVLFGKNYRLSIKFEQKRGKTEARMCIMQGDMELDPMEASGGGLTEIASFAIRLAVLELKRKNKQQPQLIVLDEPFCFLAENKIPTMMKLIHQLAVTMNFQFVIVSHLGGVKQMENADVIDLSKQKGVA